jgi:hypothetical protein
MNLSLLPHADSAPAAVRSVTAEVSRAADGMLVIRYAALGDVRELSLPEPVPFASRRDELWRTTCFEAFVAAFEDGSYLEFNFAPSTGWAAYRFSAYRGAREDLPLPPPHFDVSRQPDRLEMTVALDISGLEELPPEALWRLNLTAIVEELDGRKSYWALAHPSGQPDFHHPDCFVLELAPAV